jgi:hypothetical protein
MGTAYRKREANMNPENPDGIVTQVAYVNGHGIEESIRITIKDFEGEEETLLDVPISVLSDLLHLIDAYVPKSEE